MTEDTHSRQMRDEWIGRQREHGNQPRAVLMKGLHPRINETIDCWHRAVMRKAFADHSFRRAGAPSIDLGCGYGRLADEAVRCGLEPVFGIDLTQQFSAEFQRHHGPAVCGELSRLPFRESAFDAAYSVTALMYLSVDDARRALLEIDRCVAPGSRVLLLEPAREFNSLVRVLLRRKGKETLSRPGFSLTEMCDDLPPASWRRVSAGGCGWMTAMLPLLALSARIPALYSRLSDWIVRRDRPRGTWRPGKVSMYRWVVFQKVGPIPYALPPQDARLP